MHKTDEKAYCSIVSWVYCCNFCLDKLGKNVFLHKLCPHQVGQPCHIRISHIVFCEFPNLSDGSVTPACCHGLLVWHKAQAQSEKDKCTERKATATAGRMRVPVSDSEDFLVSSITRSIFQVFHYILFT